ncbi:hypothetical protein BDN72DRAFT_838645 [Pluteus cervinus]|uniref:Uncharacterized protein n=1 Tax=Pluteus cervinus TaxID=181527 RepID=A0ACD3AYM4_9AGAR|nr:hypothetical protein BDN72DRAFT_838645 [Pluteus cervinus]
MQDLPTDVVEEFMLHLNGEITERLRRARLLPCCLVSRSWRAIAQPLLFSRVVIDCRSRKEELDPVYKTVSENPHLRSYIQALWINNLGLPSLKTFEALGPLLPRLGQLRIHTCDYPESSAPALERVFLTMFASERLTSLSFLDVAIPVGLFSHCTALRELDLREATFHGMDDPVPTKTTHRPKLRLQSLCVFSTKMEHVEVMEWFLTSRCPFDWSDLRTLCISERSDLPRGHEVLCQFVEHVSPSLENLLFDPPLQCCLIPPTADIPTFPRLNLRIAALGVREELVEDQNPIPWMMDFLSRLPHPRTVQEIYFHGSMKHNVEAEEWGDSWMKLDALLTSQRFDHVKVVDFFIYDGLHGEELEELTKSMRELLPNLFGQGKLLLSLPDFDLVPNDDRHWAAIKSGPWRYGVGY